MKLKTSFDSGLNSRDMQKQELVEGVRILEESNFCHAHLPQQKLFTLFSIAFQHLLFQSSKNPGIYLVRIEDRLLAEKLIVKSKDSSTRRFMERLVMGRKIKFQDSLILLDYFQVSSWSFINEFPRDKFRCALIVKDTFDRPFEIPKLEEDLVSTFGPQFYYQSIREFIPRTLVVAFGEEFKDSQSIIFPFIRPENIRPLHGVKVSSSVDLSEFERVE